MFLYVKIITPNRFYIYKYGNEEIVLSGNIMKPLTESYLKTFDVK